MKKIILTSIVLLMTLMAEAQVKVAAAMKTGDKRIYVTETTMNIASQKELKLTREEAYEVKAATADGYEVEYQLLSVGSDAADNDLMARIMMLSSGMLKGIPVTIETDKEGKPLKIKNFESVKGQAVAAVENLIDELLKSVPGAEQMVPKDALKAQAEAGLSESLMLGGFDVLALNGKTIGNGATEDYVNEQQMKMKRMYFLTSKDGRGIMTSSKLNMTTDELKDVIIAQVEQAAPEQAAMIKQNIDQLIQSGMLKMDVTEKGTYQLDEAGWPLTITSEQKTENMGQASEVKSVCKLKK